MNPLTSVDVILKKSVIQSCCGLSHCYDLIHCFSCCQSCESLIRGCKILSYESLMIHGCKNRYFTMMTNRGLSRCCAMEKSYGCTNRCCVMETNFCCTIRLNGQSWMDGCCSSDVYCCCSGVC